VTNHYAFKCLKKDSVTSREAAESLGSATRSCCNRLHRGRQQPDARGEWVVMVTVLLLKVLLFGT